VSKHTYIYINKIYYMKKNQRNGILLILLAIVILLLGGNLMREMFGYDGRDFFYSYYLNFIIPLIFIVLGIRSFLNKKNQEVVNDNKSEINSKNGLIQNEKFIKAGNYLISCTHKFFIAIALQLISLFIIMQITQNASSVKSLKNAQTFGLLTSILVFAICIAAMIDIKKAGESLKS
jgi:hypothetical protein